MLPFLPDVKVLNAALMNGGKVPFVEKDNKYHISLPSTLPESGSNVLILELDKSAMDIPIIKIVK